MARRTDEVTRRCEPQVRPGEAAPPFSLPGVHEARLRTYRLSEMTTRGAAMLAFVPAAGGRSRRVARDVEWFQFIDGVRPYVLVDATRGSDALTPVDQPVDVPVLLDDGDVAAAYGVTDGPDPATGALLLVDEGRTVRARWPGTLDAVDLETVSRTIRRVVETTDGAHP